MNYLTKTILSTTLLMSSFATFANIQDADLINSLSTLGNKVVNKKLIRTELTKKDIASILEKAKLVEDKAFLGAGSTGGGQGKNGFFRDLEAGPELTCDTTMVDFAKNYPTFQEMLTIIGKTNIGFSVELQKEMHRAIVCEVNGKLKNNIVKAQDGMIVTKTNYDQLAIRTIFPENYSYGIHVYIDKNEFDSMVNEKHQSFLLFHELLHSFVKPEPVISYINRLRSVNAKFYEIYNEGSVSEEKLKNIADQYRLNSYKSAQGYAYNYAGILSDNDETVLPIFKAILKQAQFSNEELLEIGSTFFGNSKDVSFEVGREVVRTLISHGIDFNVALKDSGIGYWGYRGTLLESTLILENLDVAEYIINNTPHYEMSSKLAKKVFLDLLNSSKVKNKWNKTVMKFLWGKMNKVDKKQVYKFNKKNLKRTGISL